MATYTQRITVELTRTNRVRDGTGYLVGSILLKVLGVPCLPAP